VPVFVADSYHKLLALTHLPRVSYYYNNVVVSCAFSHAGKRLRRVVLEYPAHNVVALRESEFH
jgi:hypothetical protein